MFAQSYSEIGIDRYALGPTLGLGDVILMCSTMISDVALVSQRQIAVPMLCPQPVRLVPGVRRAVAKRDIAGSASAAARAFAATSSAAATSSGTGGCDAAGDGRTIGFRSAGAAGFTLLVNDALAVPDDDRRRARRIVTEVAPPRIARLASVLLLVLGERAITLVIPQARPWPGRECSIDRVARFFSRLQHYLVGDAGLREWRLTR